MLNDDQAEIALEAIESAVAQAGSLRALGDQCGVSKQAVWKWVNSPRVWPSPDSCREIVRFADGVTLYELRPDIYVDPDADLTVWQDDDYSPD